jgi:hypothetical protein
MLSSAKSSLAALTGMEAWPEAAVIEKVGGKLSDDSALADVPAAARSERLKSRVNPSLSLDFSAGTELDLIGTAEES